MQSKPFERALEVQKKVCASLTTPRIIIELTLLWIDGKDLRVIKNMIWEQKAAMQVDREISSCKKIKCDVIQGCGLSPDFFSLYNEIIIKPRRIPRNYSRGAQRKRLEMR